MMVSVVVGMGERTREGEFLFICLLIQIPDAGIYTLYTGYRGYLERSHGGQDECRSALGQSQALEQEMETS